jgi:hypothetical protein
MEGGVVGRRRGAAAAARTTAVASAHAYVTVAAGLGRRRLIGERGIDAEEAAHELLDRSHFLSDYLSEHLVVGNHVLHKRRKQMTRLIHCRGCVGQDGRSLRRRRRGSFSDNGERIHS